MKKKTWKVNQSDVRNTPIVYVEWRDAYSKSGWIGESELDNDLPVTTCGYLVWESVKSIAVSSSVGSNGTAGDPLVIPKSAITKRRRVRRP